MLNIYDYEQFKVFSSNDSQAPQLDKQNNSFATILKACLITGYGDKQPILGWQMSTEWVFKSQWSAVSYAVTNDNASSFTLSAIKDSTHFATTVRSKHMFNVAGNQDWLVIANSQSVYVFLQTDTGKPWYAMIFFGRAYTTKFGETYTDVLYGGNLVYLEHNYSVHAMGAFDEWGNRFVFQALPINNKIMGGIDVFYPCVLMGNADYAIFLPAWHQHIGVISQADKQYQIIKEQSGDVLVIQTAWAAMDKCCLVLKGVV